MASQEPQPEVGHALTSLCRHAARSSPLKKCMSGWVRITSRSICSRSSESCAAIRCMCHSPRQRLGGVGRLCLLHVTQASARPDSPLLV